MRRRASHIKSKSGFNITSSILKNYNSSDIFFTCGLCKLRPDAPKAIRQYKANGDFQDVGFVGNFVDTQSILDFASGEQTKIEYYNQNDDTLFLTGNPVNDERPAITDVSGNLFLDGDIPYASNDETTAGKQKHLNTGNIVMPADYTYFTVQSFESKAYIFLASLNGFKGAGIFDNGVTASPQAGLGNNISYLKNGSSISVTTRDALHDQIANQYAQFTIKGINGGDFFSTANISYTTKVPTIQHEYIAFIAPTGQQITDIINDQITRFKV